MSLDELLAWARSLPCPPPCEHDFSVQILTYGDTEPIALLCSRCGVDHREMGLRS